jgi:hypothetical protein
MMLRQNCSDPSTICPFIYVSYKQGLFSSLTALASKNKPKKP